MIQSTSNDSSTSHFSSLAIPARSAFYSHKSNLDRNSLKFTSEALLNGNFGAVDMAAEIPFNARLICVDKPFTQAKIAAL